MIKTILTWNGLSIPLTFVGALLFWIVPAVEAESCPFGVALDSPGCSFGNITCLSEENSLFRNGNFSKGGSEWQNSIKLTDDNTVELGKQEELKQLVVIQCAGEYVITMEAKALYSESSLVCGTLPMGFPNTRITKKGSSCDNDFIQSSGRTIPSDREWHIYQCKFFIDQVRTTWSLGVHASFGADGDTPHLSIRYAHLLMLPSAVCPSSTPTPSCTPSTTPSSTATDSVTSTSTRTPSATSTQTPSKTSSPTQSRTSSVTSTGSGTSTPFSTPSASVTSTSVSTATSTATSSSTGLGTPSSTSTRSEVPALAATPTASSSETPLPSKSGSSSPTHSRSPSSTETADISSTTPTRTPIATQTSTSTCTKSSPTNSVPAIDTNTTSAPKESESPPILPRPTESTRRKSRFHNLPLQRCKRSVKSWRS